LKDLKRHSWSSELSLFDIQHHFLLVVRLRNIVSFL